MNRYLYILLFSLVTSYVDAAELPADSLRHVPVIDSLSFDEEDYFAMMDTMKLPRRNLVKQRALEYAQSPETNLDYKAETNLPDFAVRDVYSPLHQTFDKRWYDHLYIGAGIGAEQILPQNKKYGSYKVLTTLNLHVGKQLTKYSNVRLSVNAGWGYQRNTELELGRIGLKADYIYSLSTLLNGYNPARRMEVSLLTGLGGFYTKARRQGHSYSPEAHIGLQFKCYTGPQGVINIEPYVGVAADNVDLSGTSNYHHYDFFYGVAASYTCFLEDNLSKEARMKLLQDRMADERMVTNSQVEKWRTPWFLEYGAGAVMCPSDVQSAGSSLGTSATLSLGKWLSPVMGVRASVTTRMTKWLPNYNSSYVYGGVDALLNPLGFMRSFRWQSYWGMYLSLGAGIGHLMKFLPDNKKLATRSESYRIGLHAWGRISEDMQAFIEPYYMVNLYTVPYTNVVTARGMYTDKAYGVNVGMTLLIRSHKFRDLREMDNTQDYTYKSVRGVRVGIAGGMPMLQNKAAVYSGMGTNWNGLVFGEYRFNKLHSVRLQGEFLNINSGNKVSFNDTYTTSEGYSVSKPVTGTEQINRKMIFASANYMVNLTNLCSGRLMERNIELDAFLGPAAGWVVNTKCDLLGTGTERDVYHHNDYRPSASGNQFMLGADFGLKLRGHVWKGISVFLMPTFYLMHYKGDLSGLKPIGGKDFHLFHTISLGVQYKIGRLYFNPEKKRRDERYNLKRWRNKQEHKEHEDELKKKFDLDVMKKQYGY